MACGCRKYKIKSTRPEHHKLLQPCVPRHDHNHILSIIETIIIRFDKESIVFGVEGTTSSDITVFFFFLL